MRRDDGTYVSLGGAGLHSREGLYLRANKMLLLQLRQHSSLRDSGVRGEIILVTKNTRARRKEGERTRGKRGPGAEEVLRGRVRGMSMYSR